MNKLKLGILGLNQGNGHPYSWSAIFNGFNYREMKNCPFPIIPEYLSKQEFPADFLNDLAEVTHIWTQDINISKSIAKASKIGRIVENPDDIIGKVDGILLARDDAENHVKMAMNFIKAGIPIFIDKPFALSTKDAKTMLRAQVYDHQIFTCSSLRFANELMLSQTELYEIGGIIYAEGTVMNKWKTYGIHILESIIVQLSNRGRLLSVNPFKAGDIHIVIISWENCLVKLKVTGRITSPLTLNFYGTKGNTIKKFSNSFDCFKQSLHTFINQINTRSQFIPRSETLELVKIIEKGIC